MGKNQKERKPFVELVRMTWDNAKGLVIASLLREVIQVVNPYVVLLFTKCAESICTGLENKWSIALELYMQFNMNQVCYDQLQYFFMSCVQIRQSVRIFVLIIWKI